MGLDDLLKQEQRKLVRHFAVCLAAKNGSDGGIVKQALSSQMHSQHPTSLFNWEVEIRWNSNEKVNFWKVCPFTFYYNWEVYL